MKWKFLISLLLFSQGLYASTYSLEDVIESAKKEGTLAKMQHYEKLSLEAKSRAETSGTPFALTGEGVHADPKDGDSGTEYSIGISKNVMLPGVLDQERRIRKLSNEAYLVDKSLKLIGYENRLKALYHHHCLEMQMAETFEKSYRDFVELYEKKEKAYRFQEISKMELIQLKSEKDRLQAQLKALKMQADATKEELTILADLPQNGSVVFSCQDLYPVRETIHINHPFALSKRAYEKRLQSTKESLERYSRLVDSIDTYVQYTNELDIERYAVGASIPLNFTSDRYEEERAAAMYRKSALDYEFAQRMRQKRSRTARLLSRLKRHALMLRTLRKNEEELTTRLFPLVQKSYDLGEISVLEYLMNRRKLYEIRQKLYETRAAYYTTLFMLYTTIETKDEK